MSNQAVGQQQDRRQSLIISSGTFTGGPLLLLLLLLHEQLTHANTVIPFAGILKEFNHAASHPKPYLDPNTQLCHFCR
jgi:hypothetical protein